MTLIEKLERALEMGGGTHTVEDVVSQLDEGHAQLWLGDGDAVIVTQINDNPQVKVLHFWLAAGELQQVVELSEQVLEWGRSVGCERATLSGRRGWVRALADHGWSEQLTVMGREI